MTILIIEDEEKLVKILEAGLKEERYAVDTALDGEQGLKKALSNEYSLIILDIMLPKKDGFAVCKELRDHQIQTPIIMLTARERVEDRVTGLNAGADDYIMKPFGLEELFARIRAVLRRRKTADSDIWKIADIIMDKNKHEVTRAGVSVPLTPKEYRILDTLMTNKGQAITKRRLIDEVWGPGFKESNNELNVHVAYLRRKIDGERAQPLIHTVRGVGYLLKE